jgi:hypothetical protein
MPTAAESTILGQIHDFTPAAVATALVEAHKRGVTVQDSLLPGWDQMGQRRTIIRELAAALRS